VTLSRLQKRFLVLATIVLVAWLLFAFVVFPILLRRAYADPSFPILGAALSGRALHPVERYLARWRELALLLTLALAAIGCAGVVLIGPRGRAWLRGVMERWPELRVAGVARLGLLGGLLIGWAEAIPRIAGGWWRQVPPGMPGAETLWTTPLIAGTLGLVAALTLHGIARGWHGTPARPVLFFFALVGAYTFLASWRAGLHPAAVTVLAVGIALQLTRIAARARPRLDSIVRRALAGSVAAVLALATLLPAAEALRERRALARLGAAAAGSRNIVLIILDTVRAQSLSLHGYARRTTPELERWAARGVLFERGIAPSSWTLPTHATLFTGRMPHEIGLDSVRRLGTGAPTLAETLAERGYRTAGFVANLDYTTRATGLDRGFARYEDHPLTLRYALHDSRWTHWWVRRGRTTSENSHIGYKTAEDVNRDFLQWLDAAEGGPFFAFLNYADAHSPRLPQPPFDTLFAGAPPRSPGLAASRYTAAQVATFENEYDEAIAYLDHQIGLLLDELDRRGALENTFVVITSDHGEHFGEHGLIWHGNSLYLPLVHVPLFVLGAEVPAGIRIADVVSLRDVAATILDVAAGAAGLPGESLRAWWTGAARVERDVFTELPAGGNPDPEEPSARAPLHSVIAEGLQYIRNADAEEELYDILADPTQSEEVAGPERALRLAQLRALIAAGTSSAHPAGSAPQPGR
jgi:arylsulfatase A-like enzyme